MNRPLLLLLVLGALLFSFSVSQATETENLGLAIVPAPGKVVIDGKADDWDLSGGIFTSSDAENQHDKFGVWCYAMYDDKNLYLLAHWLDETPLNNPGSVKGDYGFAGDCLQFRTITGTGSPNEYGIHWTCWRDRDGVDFMEAQLGTRFDMGYLKNAKTKGGQQAFIIDADRKGYTQELAIPWMLLCRNGYTPKAGESIIITVEPNFTIGLNGRWSMKDIFKPGVTPDRVFTFMASNCWGYGTLLPKGNITPHPVRLADGREFPVKVAKGTPYGLVVDWTGLIKVKELKGFKTITFTMPEDGYISLLIKDPEGTVVRQLLNCAFYTKGKHTVKWDGLTTMNWRTPGTPVSPGAYTWHAIWHTGIGLKLHGWAGNSGNAPWDSTPTSNWGGDHGAPSSCVSDGTHVYLGWSGAEAGKAMLAVDLNGNVQWKASRGGMSGADQIAVDNGTIYAQNWGGDIFRLDAKTGGFTSWAGTDDSTDLFVKSLWADAKGKPESTNGLAAKGGKLFLSFAAVDTVMALDGQNGKLLKSYTIKSPGAIALKDATTGYILSEAKSVLVLNADTGETTPVITGLTNAAALALDGEGRIYVGEVAPHNQVKVFTPDGKQVAVIGREGGRVLVGKWTSDGMAFISNMTVDSAGKLWVVESDMTPKRVSVWNTRTGKLVKEFFGPTTYGALGGAINPLDPNIMIGSGCEWKLDPATGKALQPTATITRNGMEVSRFAVGAQNRLYLAVAGTWAFNVGPLKIYERVAEGDYRLRTEIFYADDNGNELGASGHGETGKGKRTMIWSDENGDGLRQAGEITGVPGESRFSGWYMNFSPQLDLYCGDLLFKVAGYTACGAPKYDLDHPVKLPFAGTVSADGRFVMHNGDYGVNCGWNACADILTGKTRWTYPDNFVGVHGSHNAVPPETGMIRGSYGPCGVAKLPAPIGNVWVIATNVGEWHMLTEEGYYLTRLFQPDPLKFQWPTDAVPGASMDNVPCGMGGEDFGGSISCTPDNRLFLQAGKTGFWNVEVTGLDKIHALTGAKISINAADVKIAQSFREGYLQETAGKNHLTVKKFRPAFTDNLDQDFAGAEIVKFAKQDDAAVRSTITWDTQNLYLAWEVKDNTPWVNGATDPAQMYLGGDTVDFQLGLDPKADKNPRKLCSVIFGFPSATTRGKPLRCSTGKWQTLRKRSSSAPA